MADITPLPGQPRAGAGRGAARAIRRAGRVPGIIYGATIEPRLVTFNPIDLVREIGRSGFYSRVFEVGIDGEKLRVLPREVQLDPVTDRPIHADFLHLTPDREVRVEVEVRFVGEAECPGIKRGGVLNVVRHRVELICPVDRIPASITIDLAGLDIGHGVKISAVKLPEGVRPRITTRDFTIATIAAPTVLVSEEEEAAKAAAAAAAAAGEVPVEGEAPVEGAEVKAPGDETEGKKEEPTAGTKAEKKAEVKEERKAEKKAEKKAERKIERKPRGRKG